MEVFFIFEWSGDFYLVGHYLQSDAEYHMQPPFHFPFFSWPDAGEVAFGVARVDDVCWLAPILPAFCSDRGWQGSKAEDSWPGADLEPKLWCLPKFLVSEMDLTPFPLDQLPGVGAFAGRR